jgi:hypothetical protein
VSVERDCIVEDAAAAVGASTAVGPICADTGEVAAGLSIDLPQLARDVVESIGAEGPLTKLVSGWRTWCQRY